MMHYWKIAPSQNYSYTSIVQGLLYEYEQMSAQRWYIHVDLLDSTIFA